jgi:hypothetical protein
MPKGDERASPTERASGWAVGDSVAAFRGHIAAISHVGRLLRVSPLSLIERRGEEDDKALAALEKELLAV